MKNERVQMHLLYLITRINFVILNKVITCIQHDKKNIQVEYVHK